MNECCSVCSRKHARLKSQRVKYWTPRGLRVLHLCITKCVPRLPVGLIVRVCNLSSGFFLDCSPNHVRRVALEIIRSDTHAFKLGPRHIQVAGRCLCFISPARILHSLTHESKAVERNVSSSRIVGFESTSSQHSIIARRDHRSRQWSHP